MTMTHKGEVLTIYICPKCGLQANVPVKRLDRDQ